MSSVYDGSTITISATGAEDGTEGRFLKLRGFIGKLDFKPTRNEQWYTAPWVYLYFIVTSPSASRAWALQERRLSPRTLHFTRTELFWECRHCDATESFPEGVPPFEQAHPLLTVASKPLSEIWHTVVSLYSRGKLPYGSGKLVAISGIAQHVQKENHDDI